MGKTRKWQAVLTVSASGPEFSPVLEQGGRFFLPRMAANLRYTTADVDFLESYFRNGDYDSGREETHIRLRNPTRKKFHQALDDIEQWLADRRTARDWDGGGVQICYAGHGRQGDGALVLSDGVISPAELIASLANTADNVSTPGRLRVSVMLDSCHSGAFVTEVLDACLGKHSELLFPFHLYGSCMEDESAFEESSLGHGVGTYCFSVREPTIGSIAAEAIQFDNTYGPSLALAKGELGCSLLTAGLQNPVLHWAGTCHLETCGRIIGVYEKGERMTLEEMRSWLRRERDKLVEVVRPMRRNWLIEDRASGVSDTEMRAYIHEQIEFLQNPAEWLRKGGRTRTG